MKIHDICFSEQFWVDWETVPKRIQDKFNDIIEKVSLTQQLLPSLQAHKARVVETDLWIAYISVGVHSHRFLFRVSPSGTMIVERILDHKTMDMLWKR